VQKTREGKKKGEKGENGSKRGEKPKERETDRERERNNRNRGTKKPGISTRKPRETVGEKEEKG